MCAVDAGVLLLPDFGIFDIVGVLQLVLPGQTSTQPLDHAVAQDLEVAPSAGSWSQTTTGAAENTVSRFSEVRAFIDITI